MHRGCSTYPGHLSTRDSSGRGSARAQIAHGRQIFCGPLCGDRADIKGVSPARVPKAVPTAERLDLKVGLHSGNELKGRCLVGVDTVTVHRGRVTSRHQIPEEGSSGLAGCNGCTIDVDHWCSEAFSRLELTQEPDTRKAGRYRLKLRLGCVDCRDRDASRQRK